MGWIPREGIVRKDAAVIDDDVRAALSRRRKSAEQAGVSGFHNFPSP